MTTLLFALVMVCASSVIQNQVFGAPWVQDFPGESKQAVIEGDILLTPPVEQLIEESELHSSKIKRKVWKNDVLKFWRGARVPFKLSSTLSTAARKAIQAAIKEFRDKTCVRFVPKSPQDRDYIYFYRDLGCFSPIGRQGGRQKLSVGSGCEYKGTVLHEMMHAIGFFHEHTRPDRNQYIRINWWNIEPGKSKNFESYSHGQADTLNLAYDYDSIMHYANTAFSVNLADTIQALNDPKRRFGTNELKGRFSPLDIQAIKDVYHCSVPSQANNTAVVAPPEPVPQIVCEDEVEGDTCQAIVAIAPHSCQSDEEVKLRCRASCKLC